MTRLVKKHMGKCQIHVICDVMSTHDGKTIGGMSATVWADGGFAMFKAKTVGELSKMLGDDAYAAATAKNKAEQIKSLRAELAKLESGVTQ